MEPGDRQGARLSYARGFVTLFVAYVVLGRLGLALSPGGGIATLIWPPSGISLAALVIGGPRLWPAVALGALTTSSWTGAPPLAALGMALGNTLEAVLGACVLRRIPGFRCSLERVVDVMGLVFLAALGSTTVSATLGTVSLSLAGLAGDVPQTWLVWWLGDLTSDLVLAPLLLTFLCREAALLRSLPRSHGWPILEITALAAVFALVGTLLFAQSPETLIRLPFLRPYLTFLPLIWAAIRFGPRGAAAATFGIALASVLGTRVDQGIFSPASRFEVLLAMHAFLCVIGVGGLVIGAVVSERARVEADLRESEQRQRLGIEAAQLGMWYWDIPSGELVWTPLCKAMHGLEPDEDITYSRFLAVLHPDDRERTERAVQRSLEGHDDYRIEHRVLHPDGVLRWLFVLGRCFRDAAGRPVRMVGVTMDITARKRAEQERAELLERERAARAEAQAAARAKDEFLAVLSHELRTPLQSMLGWAQALKSRRSDPQAIQKGLETIERNAKTQAQLIEDLLDISRIVAGKLRLTHARVDLARVVGAALDSAKVAASAKSIHLEAGIERVGAVIGDAERLQQVVSNLLANAIKFTPPGGTVRVGLERADDHACIVVKDTGSGIPTAFLPMVFERFRQADSTSKRAHGGLGLGLAIVRHIVEQHGGTVHADSPGVGAGATFKVSLPLAPAEQRAPITVGGTDGKATASYALDGVSVLVVDDDPDARELLDAVLRASGADVCAACSAREALDRIEVSPPDVVISDIGMPEEDGLTLIRELRARELVDGRHLPAIALTAYASAADREQAIALGFDAYIAKPASPAEVALAVASHARRG